MTAQPTPPGPPVLTGLPLETIEVNLAALDAIRERFLDLSVTCASLQEQTGTITDVEQQAQVREDSDLWLTLQGQPPILPNAFLAPMAAEADGVVVDELRVILTEDIGVPGAPSAWIEHAERGVHPVLGWAVYGPEAERGTLPATAYAASLREAVFLGRELLRLRARRITAERWARDEHDQAVASLVDHLQRHGA